MKLVTMPSPSMPALLLSALALCLAACESLPTEPETDAPTVALPAPEAGEPDAPRLPATLEGLIRNTQLATPADLYAASMAAVKLNRLTDAGVLYQEAQTRRLTDLRRFPPSTNAQGTLKEIEKLKNAASAALGPKLLDKPRLYALIAKRMENRDCNSGIGYQPAWTHARTVQGIYCESIYQQKVRLMRDLSVLLTQPDYAEAAQLAEYYQSSSSSVRELAGLKEGYLRALATMRGIERKQKRLGLSQ